MSGKPKPGRLDPAGEAAELREAARIAHEAAADLRDATKESKEWVNRTLPAAVRAAFEERLSAEIGLLSEAVQRDVQGGTDRAVKDILAKFDDLMNILLGVRLEGDNQPGIVDVISFYRKRGKDFRAERGIKPPSEVFNVLGRL